jgi:hypothetical protein
MKIFEDTGWSVDKKRTPPCIKDFTRVMLVEFPPSKIFIETVDKDKPGAFCFNFKVDNVGIYYRVTFRCVHDSSD